MSVEQARAHGLRVLDFRAVRGVLGGLIAQIERAARVQRLQEEKGQRNAERQREQARRLAPLGCNLQPTRCTREAAPTTWGETTGGEPN